MARQWYYMPLHILQGKILRRNQIISKVCVKNIPLGWGIRMWGGDEQTQSISRELRSWGISASGILNEGPCITLNMSALSIGAPLSITINNAYILGEEKFRIIHLIEYNEW